jgi:RNA polymerase sigma factor (TIGR02999 family)
MERRLDSSPGEITQLLFRWKQGEPDALDRLMPLVYPHLRQVAAAYIRRESDPGVLQATALVHEVYLRLVGQGKGEWADRAHFYAFSARVMRMILTDHARSRDAQKRGGGAGHVPLNEQIPWVKIGDASIIDLNRALNELDALDPQKVQLVELRYFLGCTAEETAGIMHLSKATVDREAKFARSWLYRRIHTDGSADAANA